MAMQLSTLIENVGRAVLNANVAIEQTAVAAYLGQGYDRVEMKRENGNEYEYIPVGYKIQVPTTSGNKMLHVPVTALMEHSSLQLAEVDVKLKFEVEEDDGDDVMVSVRSPKDSKDNFLLSELSLQFKTSVSSEGIARLNNRYVQSL